MTEDHAQWLKEKSVRMHMMRALIDTAFLGPGRDFKTIVTAVVLNEKLDRMYVDEAGLAANLGAAKKRGLIAKRMVRSNTLIYVGARIYQKQIVHWKITNAGIRAFREAEVLKELS